MMRRFLLISAGVHLSLLLAFLVGRELVPAPPPPPMPPPRTVQVDVVRDPGADKTGSPAQEKKPAKSPSPPIPVAAGATEPAPAPKTQPAPTPPPVRLGDNDPGLTDDVWGPSLVPPGPDPAKENLPPRYPEEAARRGEQGSVALLIDIDASGAADSVAIQSSSGSASLDEAARAAVLRWHFTPEIRDGHPVGSEISYVFNFCIGCRDGLDTGRAAVRR